MESFTSNCSESMEIVADDTNTQMTDNTHPLASISPKPISLPFGTLAPPPVEIIFENNYQPAKRKKVAKGKEVQTGKRRGR